MLLLATFDLSGADLTLFEQYEAAVLPLLQQHGGRLLQRVRSLDAAFEIHLLEFADEAGFAGFRSDPDRQAAQPLFERSGAESMVTPVENI
ncbi:MAG: hypothetical protein AB7F98_09165 [Novosphingobium sp.]